MKPNKMNFPTFNRPSFQLSQLLAIFLLLLLFYSCGKSESKTTVKSTEAEWETIFNGKNLEGWTAKLQHHESGDNYANTFLVVDGIIQVNYDGYERFDERYGHLFYKKPYSSFHLKFDYRFTDQWMEDAPSYTYRNSGVGPYLLNTKCWLMLGMVNHDLQETCALLGLKYSIMEKWIPDIVLVPALLLFPGTNGYMQN